MSTLPCAAFLFASVLAAVSCSEWEDPANAANSQGGNAGMGGTATGGVEAVVTGGTNSTCSAAPGPTPDALPIRLPTRLHAVGNTIQDGEGNTLVLRGVNRSGTEYSCVSNTGGIFDGPSNEASVRAMASWPINAVRVPLNEACWLGINGAPVESTSEIYQNAIKDYVLLLQKYGLVPILDLHWAIAGSELPKDLLPLPNVDHTPDFWTSVANTFLDNDGVVFELYNEPYWNRYGAGEAEASWQCWRDGCTMTKVSDTKGVKHPDYEAAGMQQLVRAVRDTGAKHLVLIGGLQFSNDLSQWLQRAPVDPLENIAAAWHVYNFNACRLSTCADGAPAVVAATVPLIATELGEDDCAGDQVVHPLFEFLDANASGYLAWSWNAHAACAPAVRENGKVTDDGAPWSLVTSYTCPLPNGGYAQTFYDHLKELAR